MFLDGLLSDIGRGWDFFGKNLLGVMQEVRRDYCFTFAFRRPLRRSRIAERECVCQAGTFMLQLVSSMFKSIASFPPPVRQQTPIIFAPKLWVLSGLMPQIQELVWVGRQILEEIICLPCHKVDHIDTFITMPLG